MRSLSQPRVEPSWWTSEAFDGRPMTDVLRDRDFGSVFAFLGSRGWSRAAISAATGLSETRVRAILQGKQRITSYDVLERIADGLMIDRGLLGLAYAVRRDPAGEGQGNRERRPGAVPVVHTVQPGRAPGTGQPTTTSNLFQLPPDIADFTGRAEECAELVGRLTGAVGGNATVVCALSGKGGVGKTSLAVHVAHLVRAGFPDGQMYVDLRGVQAQPADPVQVLGRFLNELGVDAQSIPDRLEDRARLYRAQLASRSVLVVLDNACDERQVKPLLPGDPGCAVLVTGRKRLIGLEGAYQLSLDVMTAEQGQGLLGAVIGTSRIASDPEAVGEIVRHCGHLPLALRIAGARLASRPREPLGSYARRLADERGRLDLLRAGDLEVRTTFALSYRGCGPELQRAFRLLSVLETASFAPWALSVLMDVAVEHAEDLLEQLVDVELVEIAGEDGAGGCRYRFHDLLMMFARECMSASESAEERRAAAGRLLNQFALLGGTAAALLEPGGLEKSEAAPTAGLAAVRRDPRAWFRSERTAFVNGVRLASELELWQLSWRIAELLPSLFRWQSDWADWAETHRIGLDAAKRCASPDGEARIRCSLGLLYRAQGRFGDAIAEFERSATIFTDTGDVLRAAVARRQLGDTYRYTGRLDEGVIAFTRALPVFERHRSVRMTAGTLNGLGDIYRGLSRWAESTDCFERCIALYESLDDHLAVARTRVRLGILHRDRCLYDDAERLYLTGLTTLRDLNDQRWVARALRHLGVVHRNTGRIPTALEYLDQARTTFQQLADHRGVAVATRNIGDAHRYVVDLDSAEQCLVDALRRFRELGDERWTARSLHSLADTIRHGGEWARATGYLEEAMATFSRIGDTPGQGRVWRSFGILHRDQQRWQESLDALERSEALFAALGNDVWLARALAGRARTERAAGRDCGRSLLEEAERICRAGGALTRSQVEDRLREW